MKQSCQKNVSENFMASYVSYNMNVQIEQSE